MRSRTWVGSWVGLDDGQSSVAIRIWEVTHDLGGLNFSSASGRGWGQVTVG